MNLVATSKLDTKKPNKKRYRLVITLIVPVLLICVLFSYILTAVLTPPLESFIHGQSNAVLVHASDLGLLVCEERMADLLDLGLENSASVVGAYKKEALEQIKNIGLKFRKWSWWWLMKPAAPSFLKTNGIKTPAACPAARSRARRNFLESPS
jgi:hypothetical protein